MSGKTAEKTIFVGKCGAPHGIKGWIKVFSYTDPTGNILNYQPWLIEHKGQWQSVKVVQAGSLAKSLIVQLEGVTDRNQAQLFTNASIAIYRDQLPPLPKGEYYWTDLEGLEVRNLDGFVFGKITHLMSTGANDVMFIEGDKSHCLPYLLDQVVKEVDLTAGTLLVDWPEDI